MAEDSYDSLLKELINFIHERGKVDVDELLRWASRKNVGTLVLSLLVKDALEKGEIKGCGEEVVLDSDLGLSVPQSLLPRARTKKETIASLSEQALPLRKVSGEAPSKKSRKQVQRRRKRRTGGHTSIIAFLRDVEREETRVPMEMKSEITIADEDVTPEEAVGEAAGRGLGGKGERARLAMDEDMLKAIEYLSMYWSVGEIRFLEDLKQQGVKNPGDVLKRLIELGYVERSRIGVINATSKLPRVKPKSYLSDLF